MTDFALSQVLVGLALVTDVAAFQFKRKETVLSWLVCSCILIAAHFVLLEQYTASAIVAVTGLRFFISIFTKRTELMWFFLTANLYSYVFTYESFINTLPLISAQLSTIGGFSKSDKIMRELFGVSALIWIFHNVMVWTPVGILLEVLFLGSNVFGYYRYYLRGKPQEI